MVQSRKKSSGKQSKSKKKARKEKTDPESPDQAVSADLLEGDKKFEDVFGEVEDYAIFLLNPHGEILSWNKGAEKIKGYTAEEIVGRNYRMFHTQEDRDNRLSEKLLDEARKNGRVTYEGWRVRKNGVRFWGSITITALHNRNGDVKGFLKVTRDLMEKKIAEDNYSNFVEELKLKNEALKKSEERYHKMIAGVKDYAIILLDQDGRVLDWNKGAETLKGYSSSDIVGKSFRLFYPKEEKDSGLPEQLLAEAIKNGSISHEGWRLKKDGTRFWGSVTITSLHGDNAEVIGFSKVTRDLTAKKISEDRLGIMIEELKQANEHLRQSEERYHQMIAEIQDYAIILLSKDGKIENWNTGAEYIKGYKANEIIGKHFRLFYPEEDRKRKLPESLLEFATKHGKATHEGWRVRKDGTRFWGSIVITAVHDRQGEIIGFSKVTRDLTERKNAEDQLKMNAAQLDLKNKTLERLNEDLSSFTHVASHDLKEPLRKIQTFVARIESTGYDPEKTREYLDKIKTSAVGMHTLIEDLLSYSQVSNDHSHSFEKTDLNKVIDLVVSDLDIPIQEKQATIECGRLPVIFGIPHQLRQLFLNLISNAVKFSKANEAPRVVIRSETIKGPDLPGAENDGANKYHHITVADNGIGFPHQQSDKIFEAFQRLHPRSTFSGTGIGLAIVKKVIENHHGVISAEGEPGVGAVFHLYLPIAGQPSKADR